MMVILKNLNKNILVIDGIILSKSCYNSGNGDFKYLSDIHYVPCYETPFDIIIYEKSLYTSIQIHSCSGNDGGILSINYW